MALSSQYKPSSASASPFDAGFWRGCLGEARNLVVFSCAFALIFNAFYSDGIELKYKEPKKIYLPDFLKAQRESSRSVGGGGKQRLDR